MNKGYISETMGSSRILAHGKIAELPFKLASAQPFSVFIIPKVENPAPILITCQLNQDDAASACPFEVNTWTAPAITEIPLNGVNLANYDIYWGAGADVSES